MYVDFSDESSKNLPGNSHRNYYEALLPDEPYKMLPGNSPRDSLHVDFSDESSEMLPGNSHRNYYEALLPDELSLSHALKSPPPNTIKTNHNKGVNYETN